MSVTCAFLVLVYSPVTDILPDAVLISSLSIASRLGLPCVILTSPSDDSDSGNEFSRVVTPGSGMQLFSAGLGRVESWAPLDKSDCDAAAEPVIKIRIDTVKEGGAS